MRPAPLLPLPLPSLLQHRVLLVLLLLASAITSCGAIQWLGLYKLEALGGRASLGDFCKAMQLQSIFDSRQTRFCKKWTSRPVNPAIVSSLIEASKQTLALCQQQFRGFRWNCGVLEHVPQLAPELRTLTAEQALVHAMSGFVLATTFANDCARGAIANCPCGAEPTWLRAKWPGVRFSLEGCHTNLRMGQRLARQFLGFGGGNRQGGGRDGQRPRRRQRQRPRRSRDNETGQSSVFKRFVRMVNRHNYRVGIKATKHSEAVRCKCHGNSASCTIRTCYKVLHQRGIQMLPSAYVRRTEDDPVDLLINLYDKQNLRRTIFDERGYQGYEERCTEADRQAASNPLAAKPKCEAYKVVRGRPRLNVLLFKEHSLDYCGLREGVYPGTSDRECLPDGSPQAEKILAADSGERRREILCSVMCCGRPYRNVTVTYPGSHRDCKAKSCRLLQNPFRVDCQPCVLAKSFCS